MRIAKLALGFVMLCAAPAWADEWVRCAIEDGYCRVDGTSTVRFGSGNQWSTQRISGGVNCSRGTFGDPAPGVKKACDVLVQARVPQNRADRREDRRDDRNDNRYDARNWEKCADEGRRCRFDGTATVKYGAGSQWATRRLNGGARCSSEAFGGDPAVGVTKSCYIVYDDGGNRGTTNRGDAGGWAKCANESGVCAFNGRRRVSYGADNRWVIGYFIGSVSCQSSAFGSDPAPGVVKSCYYERR